MGMNFCLIGSTLFLQGLDPRWDLTHDRFSKISTERMNFLAETERGARRAMLDLELWKARLYAFYPMLFCSLLFSLWDNSLKLALGIG